MEPPSPDDLLTSTPSPKVVEHLASCAICRAERQLYLDVFEPTRALSGTLPVSSMDESGMCDTSIAAEATSILVDGPPRGTSIAQESCPLSGLITILRKVCEAVGYAHSRGVVHRDLKPDNIMLGSHGEVWVMDWGLSGIVSRSADGIQTVRSAAESAVQHRTHRADHPHGCGHLSGNARLHSR